MTSRGCCRWRSSWWSAPRRHRRPTRASPPPPRPSPRGDRRRGGALEAYRAAALAESSSTAPSAATLAARKDLADLTFRRQDWTEAAAAYQSLLAHPEGLARDAQLAAYERLGIARLRAGQPAEAIEPLEKAVALDPRRTRALEALVEAARASENDDAVVRHTQALLAVTEDPRTKLGLLEHVATIHSERRNDPQRAIAAYLEALKIWPDERSIMHRLLELYTDTKQWKQSVQLLGRLATLADDATRAPYFVAAGNILSEELSARTEAIEAFEQALDADPVRPQDLRAHRPAGDGGARLEDGGARLPAADQAARHRVAAGQTSRARRAVAWPGRD